MRLGINPRSLCNDLKIGVLFSTRLPLGHSSAVSGTDIARASWALPLAGTIVGLMGAAAYWIAYSLGLPPLPAATLSVIAALFATGCLHEDGLADTVDGFGGGATRQRKLEIMRDSGIGAYGTCALTALLLLRAATLASLAEPAAVAGALIAAHASARATVPPLMRIVPPARTDGLAVDAGVPPLASVFVAGLLGAIILAAGLGFAAAFVGLALLISAVALMAWICRRQIGGQTGDVLGALEQVSEVLILLIAASRV
jgi:adenosylcobinamide-GDP ribazoletransferase